MTDAQERKPNLSVLKALRVLETVAHSQPVGLTELSRALDLPKATTQRSLVSLEMAGWLTSDESGRWSTTARLYSVGTQGAQRFGVRDVAMPVLSDLQEATGETIHLTVQDGNDMVLIERLDTPHHLRTMFPLGSRIPMHASANGKAFLAALPDARVDEYLTGTLASHTDHTLTDPDALWAEIAKVRKRGFSVGNEELNVGVVAVGAAIVASGGTPRAAFSVSAPKARLTREKVGPTAELVAKAATAIAAKFDE